LYYFNKKYRVGKNNDIHEYLTFPLQTYQVQTFDSSSFKFSLYTVHSHSNSGREKLAVLENVLSVSATFSL
jgi:hypothetical protein